MEDAPPALPVTSSPPIPVLAFHDAPLSERELQVLKLVVQGLTNRVIAEQLIISAHTVNMHLRSTFAKLDGTSRAAAIRFALEHNLG